MCDGGSKHRQIAKSLKWPGQLISPDDLLSSLQEKTINNIKLSKYPISSKIVLQFIGGLGYLLVHYLNRTRVVNHQTFKNELRFLEINNNQRTSLKSETNRPKNLGPLITYSNHVSCLDDPLLWASLFPFNYYTTQTESIRWTAAAVEICFKNPFLSAFFSLGKTFPIVRGAGLNQPAMDFALGILNHNQWLHLFPEGRVMRGPNQEILTNQDRGYILKWGMSKLILDYFKSSKQDLGKECNKVVRILPFYHLGLEDIFPVGGSYIPRVGQKITILVRPSVIEMNLSLLNHILQKSTLNLKTLKSKSNDSLSMIKLTNYFESQLDGLKNPLLEMHKRQDL